MRKLSIEESRNIFDELVKITHDNPRLADPVRCAASVFQNPRNEIISDADMCMFDHQIVWCLKGAHSQFVSPDVNSRLRDIFNKVHKLRGDGISITSYEMSIISDDVIRKDGHVIKIVKCDEDINEITNCTRDTMEKSKEFSVRTDGSIYGNIYELFINGRNPNENYTKLIQSLTMVDPNLVKEVNDRLKVVNSNSVMEAAKLMGGD